MTTQTNAIGAYFLINACRLKSLALLWYFLDSDAKSPVILEISGETWKTRSMILMNKNIDKSQF